jgi:hypothetical protein
MIGFNSYFHAFLEATKKGVFTVLVLMVSLLNSDIIAGHYSIPETGDYT